MKINRILILILALVFGCFSVFIIIQTYAKYSTSANGLTSIPIAKWNIVVNTMSIKNTPNISSAIVPVFPGNANIASNIIAPTAEGYFDLNFDFSNADVSFSYVISSSVNASSSVKDLVATGYSINGGPKINFANFNENISDTVLLQTPVRNRSIRIYIMWNDNHLTSTMNNAADTISTTSSTAALFDIKIAFTQIV